MNCRACNSVLTQTFIDLGHTPDANLFPTKEQLNKPELWYPLKVMVCSHCQLVQMDEYKKATDIFNENYPYYSSYSEENIKRAQEYCDMMIEKYFPKRSHPYHVLEVGSNDGYLLQFFKKRGFHVQGIDPASGAAEVANHNNIPTIAAFFGMEFFAKSPWMADKYDLICGSNVLAHQVHIGGFIEAIRLSLREMGVVTMEFPTIRNLLSGECQFDTVYHEHYHYLSLFSAINLFGEHGLEIFDVKKTPIQGGSIMIFAQHFKGRHKVTERLMSMLVEDCSFNIDKPYGYLNFQNSVNDTKLTFMKWLTWTVSNKKTVAAYGASCKCNTFFNFCGVRPDLVNFVVDRSPLKIGKYLPGSHIPIVTEDHLREQKPNYVIITAWNLREEVVKQLQYIREWGGKFVITTPMLQIF